MKVKNFLIKFQYNTDNRGRMHTKCIISSIVPLEEPIVIGETITAKCDNFCKDEGRKLALKRATSARENQERVISKEDSSDIWESYRLMTSKSRW